MMEDKDFKKFRELVAAVYSLYGRDITESALMLWWNILKKYTIDEVRAGLSNNLSDSDNGSFIPKPADVIRMIEGNSGDKALAAWSKVDAAVKSVGTYRSVAFDDALIHAVIDEMGGWIALGNRVDKEWDFVKNEFLKRYAAHAHKQATPAYSPVLHGIFTLKNRDGGYGDDNPVLVGNADSAQKVMISSQNGHAIKISREIKTGNPEKGAENEKEQIALLL